jgi:hypothetical protein
MCVYTFTHTQTTYTDMYINIHTLSHACMYIHTNTHILTMGAMTACRSTHGEYIVSCVDTGYAGSNGIEPQVFGSNNQSCGYICYGFGEFDGQGSGHDFSGNVSCTLLSSLVVPDPICPAPLPQIFHPGVIFVQASRNTSGNRNLTLKLINRIGTRPSALSTAVTARAVTRLVHIKKRRKSKIFSRMLGILPSAEEHILYPCKAVST